jgi:uncharacterized protein (DUF885 family)
MPRLLAAVLLATVSGFLSAQAPTSRAPSAQSRLDAILEQVIARGGRGRGTGGDPATLLAELRTIDLAGLTPAGAIDRRFAESILVGRQLAAERRDGPMGEGAYTRMLREQYLLPYDAAGLWAYAQSEFDRTVAQLETLARKIDTRKSWLQIANEVKADHPEASTMIEAHQQVVDRARAHLVSKDLIPLPWPERCTVVPRRPGPGNNPYYGSFSGATARPPAADGAALGEWQINPFDPSWDEAKQRDYLLEHDWGVILVTAPHETYGGHHVQIIYQMHNPSPLRRAMSTPMFSEGWGLYNEQLFQETGFFPDERIHLRQLQLRLWRNARVIYDVGLQTGRMTRDQAIALMVDRVGFLRWAAEAEVDSALARPGYFIGYFMGMSEILKMRDAYRARMGDRFTLRDFHQHLLEIGSMPPALVREALLAR